MCCCCTENLTYLVCRYPYVCHMLTLHNMIPDLLCTYSMWCPGRVVIGVSIEWTTCLCKYVERDRIGSRRNRKYFNAKTTRATAGFGG